MKTCSEMLREAREAKGLTLEELAVSTKISLHLLKALESADFTVLPQTYVKGFLRNYARQLGLDPSEVVQTYEAQQKATEEISAAPKKVEWKTPQPFAWHRWVLLAGFVVVVLGGFLLLRRGNVEEPLQSQTRSEGKPVSSHIEGESILSSLEEDEMVVAEPDQDTLIIIYRDTAASASRKMNMSPAQSPAFAELSGTSQPAGSQDFQQAPTPAPRPVVKLNLRAQAVSDTWMKVLCDGVPVYEGMLRSGSTSGWEADSLFALKMSKAGGVRLSLNGRPLGDLGPVNNVVSSLIVNRDGIVKKELK